MGYKMKKALLIGILLVVVCVYFGLVNTQALKAWDGHIYGDVTYPYPWEHYYQDTARILNSDFSWTEFWDFISSNEPNTYSIWNDLESDYYRLRIYANDCEKQSISPTFYYLEGSEVRKDGVACVDGTPEK